MSVNPYRIQRVVYRTLEPVHPGAGGYRLGRVDNTICREPGTHLPKIPGTSLAGASRAYAALAYGKPEAAGQHMKLTDRENCPILFVFGTPNDTEGGQAGKVSFGDAHILFFPVATMHGPVWVTTAELVKRYLNVDLPAPSDQESLAVAPGITNGAAELNLGWLLFSKVQPFASAQTLGFGPVDSRLVVVHESLFSQVVNSNLEVRTSVSIDHETGAAKSGALFTYEAIPRDTYLAHEIVEDNFTAGSLSVPHKYKRPNEPLTGWDSPLQIALAGLHLINPLGIGGMGTRGFGRMEIVAGGAPHAQ